MNTIDVLIVVDVEGALATKSLQNNVYLVDTNKYIGSWGEGGNELVTSCKNLQTISWSVASVAPSNDVEIVGFTGQMVDDKICAPQPQGGTESWTGTVQSQGFTGQQQYSVILSMDGAQMTFDPFLQIS